MSAPSPRVRNVFVGSPIERLEDLRFLTGRGQYVDDLACAGMLHAVILRSSVAHGHIRSIDTAAARTRPGVHAVLTAADVGEVPTIPFLPMIIGHDGLGEVVEVGSDVSNVHVGDRVVVMCSITCGYCKFCRSDRQHLCLAHRVMGFIAKWGEAGSKRILRYKEGLWAEYCRVPATNVVRLRPEVREFIRNRKWVHRGDVVAYGPNISCKSFSTDAAGFRHSVFEGKQLGADECATHKRYGLVLGPIFGLVSGAANGITLAWEFSRAARHKPQPGFWYDTSVSAIRGCGYGLGVAYLFGPICGIVFGALSTVGQVIAYQAGIRPTIAYAPATRLRMNKLLFFTALNRTVGYGIAGYVSALIAHQRAKALSFGLEVGLVIGIVTAISGSGTPLVEWGADHLPAKLMGVIGVGLILIGFALQSVQYWLTLFDVGVR